MEIAAVFVSAGLVALAAALGVQVYRHRQPPKNPARVPFTEIEARVLQEREVEWPTASHLQRESCQAAGIELPAVRVPRYIGQHLAAPIPRQRDPDQTREIQAVY